MMRKEECNNPETHEPHTWSTKVEGTDTVRKFKCAGRDRSRYQAEVTPDSVAAHSRSVGRIEADDVEQVCEVVIGHTYVRFAKGKGSACSCGMGNIKVEVVR